MTKWPKRVKHRNKVLAKIYRPCAGRSSYRVAWTVAGKRMMKTFPGHAVCDLTKAHLDTYMQHHAGTTRGCSRRPRVKRGSPWCPSAPPTSSPCPLSRARTCNNRH